MHVPDYKPSFGRHQLVLDLSREDVREYILNAMRKVFSCTRIDYIKWDMNRHMTEAFSAKLEPARQMETQHRYMLGLYELMEKLTAEFPDILFESCSGGGRFQLGKFTRFLTGGNEYAWQFSDEKRVVVMYFKILAQPAEPIRILRLAELDADKIYMLKKYLPPKNWAWTADCKKFPSTKNLSFERHDGENYHLRRKTYELDF